MNGLHENTYPNNQGNAVESGSRNHDESLFSNEISFLDQIMQGVATWSNEVENG